MTNDIWRDHFCLIRTIWLLRIIPLDVGVSYYHILATLDFGVLYIRALTQTIKRNYKMYAGIQSAMEFIIEKKHSNHCECYFNQSSYRQQYNFGAGHRILNLTYFQLETLILSNKLGLRLWIRWCIFLLSSSKQIKYPLKIRDLKKKWRIHINSSLPLYKMHNKKSVLSLQKVMLTLFYQWSKYTM